MHAVLKYVAASFNLTFLLVLNILFLDNRYIDTAIIVTNAVIIAPIVIEVYDITPIITIKSIIPDICIARILKEF
jgi:hypothetical protein